MDRFVVDLIPLEQLGLHQFVLITTPIKQCAESIWVCEKVCNIKRFEEILAVRKDEVGVDRLDDFTIVEVETEAEHDFD